MLNQKRYTANLISHTSFTITTVTAFPLTVALWSSDIMWPYEKKKKKKTLLGGTEIILKLQTFTLANSMEVIYL